MCQRRSNDGEFKTVTNIRDASFNGSEENFNTFLLVGFIFFRSRCKLFPRFVRFSSR
jgi:hypothetical protein